MRIYKTELYEIDFHKDHRAKRSVSISHKKNGYEGEYYQLEHVASWVSNRIPYALSPQEGAKILSKSCEWIYGKE